MGEKWAATVKVEFEMEDGSTRAAMDVLRGAVSEFARYIERGDPTLAAKTGVKRDTVKAVIASQGPPES